MQYFMGIDNLFPVEAGDKEDARQEFLDQVRAGEIDLNADDLIPKVVDVAEE